MRSAFGLLSCVGLLASGCVVTDALSPVGNDDDSDTEVYSGGPATGIDIDKIAVNQGVDIVVWEKGSTQEPDFASVVARRAGIMRVFVNLHDGFEHRDVKGVLTMKNGDDITYLEDVAFIDEDSKQNKLGSTINFYFDPDVLLVNTEVSVELIEVSDEEYSGDEGDSRAPSDGTFALNAKSTDVLEVVLLPIEYNADGSGRLPDTRNRQINRYKDLLQAMYPAKEVVVSVGNTIKWNKTIGADGSGWSSILTRVMNERSAAKEDPNTYYYGLFEPKEDFYDFCAYGCVLGLSTLGGPTDVWSRASVGLGYTGDTSADTMVHEVGHAHGREHAPCGLGGQSSDPQYPYSQAELGVWGYNYLDDELYKATSYVDMMSYCSPIWISDYTYGALYERIKTLKSQRSARAADVERSYRSVVVAPDGTSTIGELMTVFGKPGGEPRSLEWMDDSGSPLKEVPAFYYPFSHIEGGIVLVEEPNFDVTGARLVSGR